MNTYNTIRETSSEFKVEYNVNAKYENPLKHSEKNCIYRSYPPIFQESTLFYVLGGYIPSDAFCHHVIIHLPSYKYIDKLPLQDDK